MVWFSATRPDQSLASILCLEERRMVAEDYVVQFERRLLQIQCQTRVRLPFRGSQVIVRKWLDGSIRLLTRDNTELLVEELRRTTKETRGGFPVGMTTRGHL